MKFVSNTSDVEKKEVIVVNYDSKGKPCEEGRHVLSETTIDNKKSAKALIVGGLLYDPKNRNMPKDREYRVVSMSCFNKYLTYLTSGEYHDYEKAAREFRKVN